MTSIFKKRITLFQNPPNLNLLCCNLRGIERETLRVTPEGTIAETTHPKALGSTLTHPHITTDYSEALLEFITEPFPKISSVLDQLENTHRFTIENLSNHELLWPSSMPCALGEDKDIPIAQYGSSNVGTMKTVYRQGLGHRYGRKMQTIAGIHFNFSVPDAVWCQMRTNDASTLTLQDYRTKGYMGLVRNFRRRFWLLLYLTGASPVADKSFVEGRDHDLETLNERDLYLPKATSLRMGDLGYQSSAQDDLYVCYNNLGTYVSSLREALLTNYAPYNRFSAENAEQSAQLSTSVLQIENEFYSTIRPKQTTRSGETQLKALKERGVEYIEVRCTDINPFDPLGISREQIDFIELFLLGCLFDESPDTTPEEYREVLDNQRAVVRNGRQTDLQLVRDGEEVAMQDWASEIMQMLRPIAEIMDRLCDEGNDGYKRVLESMQSMLDDPEKTLSARVLREMTETNTTFVDWSLAQAKKHTSRLKNEQLNSEQLAHFQHLVRRSLDDQKEIEDAETESFNDYVDSYFKQYRELQSTV